MNAKLKACLLATGLILIAVVVLLLLSNYQLGRQSDKSDKVREVVQEIFDAPDQSCLMGSDGRASILHVPVPDNMEATRWISNHPTGVLVPFSKQPAVHEMWWLTHLTIVNKPDDPGWQDCFGVYKSQQF